MQLRIVSLFCLVAFFARAEQAPTPLAIFAATLTNIVEIIEPSADTPARTFTTRLQFSKADGISQKFAGSAIELAVQAPDHLLISAKAADKAYRIARNGQQLWAYV